MRKYLKAHKCKHIKRDGYSFVFVKDSCPYGMISKNGTALYVNKESCRECDKFEEVEK